MSTTSGGLNVFASQKKFFDYLSSVIPWDVIDAEVPDGENVHLVSGVLRPYVVVRFTDLLKASGQSSFGGTRQDGYYSMIQTLSVAPSGLQALELSSLVNDKVVGHVIDVNCGPLEKDFGGGSLNIKGVNSNPSFFVSIAAFRFLTNMNPE